MKHIILIAALFVSSLSMAQNSINEFFETYNSQEGVTTIKVAKPMFQLISKFITEEEDLQKVTPLLGKINSLRIIIIEKDAVKPAAFDKAQSDIQKILSKLKYEELMEVNSDGERIRILANNLNKNVVTDIILSIVGPDENIFLILEGDLSMDDLNGLISPEEK